MRTEDDDEEEEVEQMDAESDGNDEDASSYDLNAKIQATLLEGGMIYTHSGTSCWLLILVCALTFHVTVFDPVSDGSGVFMTWESKGPTDEEISEMTEVTESGLCKFSIIGESSSSIFFSAPQLISAHHSSQKRKFVSEQHYKWLVVSFLWKEKEEENSIAINEEFDFAKELQLTQQT